MSGRALVRTAIESPVGVLVLGATDDGVCELLFRDERPDDASASIAHPVLAEATRQLATYFAGELRSFDLPLAPAGTDFQRAVWRALLDIPFGETRSYADIARAIGNPAAVRAVGLANGRNPISIVVPCHRVIGSDGSLTGYGGGLDRKRGLLRHEGIAAGVEPMLFEADTEKAVGHTAGAR